MKSHPGAQGMALVEAMVASLVLAVGVLGAARLILHAQASTLETRAQAQAERLAHEALNCALAGQSPCPAAAETVLSGMRYTVTLERSTLSPALQGLQATVEWRPEGSSTTAPRRLRWPTRVSTLPDWHGLSSP